MFAYGGDDEREEADDAREKMNVEKDEVTIEDDEMNVAFEKLFSLVEKMDVEHEDASARGGMQSVMVHFGNMERDAEDDLLYCNSTKLAEGPPTSCAMNICYEQSCI